MNLTLLSHLVFALPLMMSAYTKNWLLFVLLVATVVSSIYYHTIKIPTYFTTIFEYHPAARLIDMGFTLMIALYIVREIYIIRNTEESWILLVLAVVFAALLKLSSQWISYENVHILWHILAALYIAGFVWVTM